MFLSFSFAHHIRPCFCPSPLLTTQCHVFVLLLCSPHNAMFLSFSFAHHIRPCFCPPLLTTQGHVFVLLLCSPHKAMFLSFSFAHHTRPCFCPSPLLTTQGLAVQMYCMMLCSNTLGGVFSHEGGKGTHKEEAFPMQVVPIQENGISMTHISWIAS